MSCHGDNSYLNLSLGRTNYLIIGLNKRAKLLVPPKINPDFILPLQLLLYFFFLPPCPDAFCSTESR